MAGRVAIIMGSDSDYPVMKGAEEVLKRFGVEVLVDIVSAHRTPDKMFEFARTAHTKGIEVIIAGAGGAAHLPGMVASITPLPVIGVPVNITPLQGLDALLSIVQMPKGVPVATVAINNSANAGLLAVRILAVKYPELLDKMIEYQQELKDIVRQKAERLKEMRSE